MKILVDTDAIFGFYITKDIHHKKATIIYKKLLKEESELFITNLVLYETATVLSHKTTHQQAIRVIQALLATDYNPVFIDEIMAKKAFNLFFSQTKKRTSFVDCANAVVMKELKIDKIFSFDEFYKNKRLRV